MMLPVIFVMPLVQLIILLHAATLEMKQIELFVVDKDLSSTSRRLVENFKRSPFYILKDYSTSIEEAEQELRRGNVDIILHIPSGFERAMVRESSVKIQILIDAINGISAGLINGYTQAIIAGFNQKIISEWIGTTGTNHFQNIELTYSLWYNPRLNYKIFMLPALMVLLITIIGMFLSALNLVREKELGTLEQINVTPIRKYQFIVGKLVPFWIIALFELAFLMVIGKLFFNLPVLGSVGLLFGFASVYLLVVMGAGLFISTISQTQQQVMFVSFFFMILFILMSGIFTPVETMPDWAQKINIINPLAYFMRVIRMVILKGSGFSDILKEFISLSVFAFIILSLAVWRYRKTT